MCEDLGYPLADDFDPNDQTQSIEVLYAKSMANNAEIDRINAEIDANRKAKYYETFEAGSGIVYNV